MKVSRKNLTFGFLVLVSLCYVIFMLFDIAGWDPAISKGIKFASIVLCFLFSSILLWNEKFSKERLLISIALGFTILADLCLLLIAKEVLGLAFFLCVQSIYLFWLCRLRARLPKKGELEDRSRKKYKPITHFIFLLLVRLVAAFFLSFIVISNILKEELLYPLVIFYAVMFLDNIRFTVWLIFTKRYREYGICLPVLAAGLFLFACCDICVLFFNTATLFGFPFLTSSHLFDLVRIGMWFFYLPSQVMIVLSLRKET